MLTIYKKKKKIQKVHSDKKQKLYDSLLHKLCYSKKNNSQIQIIITQSPKTNLKYA